MKVEKNLMRSSVLLGLTVLCLQGCQSVPPRAVVADQAPAPVALVTPARQEPPNEQRLNQPPAPRAKDLAAPEDPFQPAPNSQQHADPKPMRAPSLPQPDYPQRLPASSLADGSAPQLELPSTGMPQPPQAVDQSQQTPPYPISQPGAVGRPTPRVGLPPALTRRPAATPETVGLPQAPIRQPSAQAAPRLPGQGPQPFKDPVAERRAKEKELEQAYLQSRADALNLKYHGGRAVLTPQSPEIMLSASAPPLPHRPPSIPGTYSVPDAFRASEVKRQEWQSYRDQPPVGLPPARAYTPPMPTMPAPMPPPMPMGAPQPAYPRP